MQNPRHIVLEENENSANIHCRSSPSQNTIKSIIKPSQFTMEAGPTGLLGTQGQRRVRNGLPNLSCLPGPISWCLCAELFYSFTHSLTVQTSSLGPTGVFSSLLFLSPHLVNLDTVTCLALNDEMWAEGTCVASGWNNLRVSLSATLSSLPQQIPKPVIYGDSSVHLDPWVIVMSYYNPPLDPC